MDWAGNFDDRKRTSGGAFFLEEKLIRWISKKQSCVSQSTTEAKYVVIVINFSNIVWNKQFLEGMQEEVIDHVTIYYDNTSVINISKNMVTHANTKHISIKNHYLREKFQENQVSLQYVKFKETIAGIFTKSLPKNAFEYLRGKLRVLPYPEFTK